MPRRGIQQMETARQSCGFATDCHGHVKNSEPLVPTLKRQNVTLYCVLESALVRAVGAVQSVQVYGKAFVSEMTAKKVTLLQCRLNLRKALYFSLTGFETRSNTHATVSGSNER